MLHFFTCEEWLKCITQRKGGLGDVTSLCICPKEVVARWESVSSPGQPVTGEGDIASRCARAALGWTLAGISSPKGSLQIGMDCIER